MLFRRAILIIHGFAGGTYDEEDLANYLELNRLYDVFQYTLPGHNRNLSKVNYQDWIEKSENMVNYLLNHGYRNIYVIGHSMGGVIATYLATKYKEIKKLVLCAPAFKYFSVNKSNISKSFKSAPEIIKTYGRDEILSRFLKLNTSALKEFSNLVLKYYDKPKEVKCPILLIQGLKDDIVPIESSKYVYENVESSIKKIVYVKDLTHDVFNCGRNYELFKIIDRFLKIPESGEYNI